MRSLTKVFLGFLLVVGVAALVHSEATTATNDTSTQSASNKNIEAQPMDIKTDGALPDKFRGGNPDAGLIHVLEDEKYKRQEHSIIYDGGSGDSATKIPGAEEGSKLVGEPTINWTTSKVNADGSLTTLKSENTNSATNENMFPEPGEYQVSNSGARQVSGGSGTTTTGTEGGATEGGAQTTTPGTEGGTTGANGQTTVPGTEGGTTGANGQTTVPGTEGGTAGAANEQRVTTRADMGVQCHDCTSPNLLACIQEGAGANSAIDEQALSDQLTEQIAGGEVTELKGSLKDANMIAVIENPLKKNARPAEKSAAVMLKGMVFEQNGKVVNETKEVPMKLLSEEEQTRVAQVGEETVPGVFVRRSIPFITAVKMSDNFECVSDNASCIIRNKATGEEVQKVGGSYMFRIPNYPRAEYQDQPDYEMVIQGLDKAGNKTAVQLPLYVVNTQTSFEGGRNE